MATGVNNLPYPGKVYSPFDILTAEELNEDVANIESLATGSGIGDGAIATAALANAAVTSPKVDFTTSVDANGWAVLNHGHYKEYFKKIAVNKSISAGGFGDETISTNLPVGVATLGTGYLAGSLRATSDPQQITLGFKATTTSTSIILALKNNYSASISYAGDIIVRLLYLT